MSILESVAPPSANFNLTLLIAETYELIDAQPPKLTPINRTKKTLSGEPAHTLGDIIFATEAAKHHSSFHNHGWAGWGTYLSAKYGEENVEMVNQLGWSDLLRGQRRFSPVDTQLTFRIHPFVDRGEETIAKVEFLLSQTANFIRKNKLDVLGSSGCSQFFTLCEYWYGKGMVPEEYHYLARFWQG